MSLLSPLIGWGSRAEALQSQSEEVGVGSEGTQEVAGATEGGAMLQKSESVEEGEEVEESKPSK